MTSTTQDRDRINGSLCLYGSYHLVRRQAFKPTIADEKAQNLIPSLRVHRGTWPYISYQMIKGNRSREKVYEAGSFLPVTKYGRTLCLDRQKLGLQCNYKLLCKVMTKALQSHGHLRNLSKSIILSTAL